MTRLYSSISALVMLTACTTTDMNAADPVDEEAYVEAVAVIEDAVIVSEPMIDLQTPMLGQIPPARVTMTRRVVSTSQLSPQTAIRQGAEKARIEPSASAYMNAIQVYPYTEGALYQLYAAPGQISDIALQPGETLVSVSAGDTVRWVVGDTLSGSGSTARSHILVKPISAGLRTNLMVATDKRTYHLELSSSDGAYMAAVSWRYPQDEMRDLQAKAAMDNARMESIAAPNLTLDDLNFEYRIEGDKPDWTPVRVFDDGRQVFIQMPDTLATTDAPPLFVRGESGNVELVNYRLRGKYYVVDHLFRAAELRLGTNPQTVVRILKGAKKRSGLAALFGG